MGVLAKRLDQDIGPQPTPILFLASKLALGGAERVIYRLLRDLDRRRFKPIACCLYDKGEIGQEIESRLGMTVYSDLMGHRLDPWVARRLVPIMRRQNVKVIYMLNTPLVQFWGTVCAKMAGVPVTVSAVHTTIRAGHTRRGALLDRLTFPFMDAIVALANTHKELLVQTRGAPADRVAVVGNGIDLEEFLDGAPAGEKRESLELGPDVPIIGVVARLVPGKGIETFLRAAEIVLRSIPQAHFLVVGEGPERARLEGVAQRLEISSSIHFLGHRRDVADIVPLFDVALLTSDPVFETFPLAVLEYMAAAKPVVATRVGSVAEMVAEGRTGFLVPPADPEACANAVLTLLRNPDQARAFGMAGRQRLEAEFTTQVMVERTEDLLERLLRDKANAIRPGRSCP